MKNTILIVLSLICLSTNASDSSKTDLNLSLFGDVFYCFDFNRPLGSQKQDFLFNHNRHNEFNLNLGLIKFNILNARYRANLGLITGTYSMDNYAAEPPGLQNIFEANIGLALNKKQTLWLDAGILPSHIGFESAISTENLTLTRSLCAENSPYFNSGAKLTFHANKKIEIAGLILNGWQRIQKVGGNSLPSFGTQVLYNHSKKIRFNWSTFIGTDDPDSLRRTRYFSNLYTFWKPSSKLELVMGFDLGAQQKSRASRDFHFWLSPVIIGSYQIHENWRMALRAEYYQDQASVIIPEQNNQGFEAWGSSVNIDYKANHKVTWRLEVRYMQSQKNIFQKVNTSVNSNFFITTGLAIRLDREINHRVSL